jgi:hypothetical protein
MVAEWPDPSAMRNESNEEAAPATGEPDEEEGGGTPPSAPQADRPSAPKGATPTWLDASVPE